MWKMKLLTSWKLKSSRQCPFSWTTTFVIDPLQRFCGMLTQDRGRIIKNWICYCVRYLKFIVRCVFTTSCFVFHFKWNVWVYSSSFFFFFCFWFTQLHNCHSILSLSGDWPICTFVYFSIIVAIVVTFSFVYTQTVYLIALSFWYGHLLKYQFRSILLNLHFLFVEFLSNFYMFRCYVHLYIVQYCLLLLVLP